MLCIAPWLRTWARARGPILPASTRSRRSSPTPTPSSIVAALAGSTRRTDERAGGAPPDELLLLGDACRLPGARARARSALPLREADRGDPRAAVRASLPALRSDRPGRLGVSMRL